MIIYNKQWIDNYNIGKAAKKWLKKGFISEEENKSVLAKYPTSYKPYIFFARLGMFLFGAFIILCAVGLYILFDGYSGRNSAIVGNLFWAIITYIAAEAFVRGRNHFRSGLVEASLYASIVFTWIALIFLLSKYNFDFNFDPLYLYSILFVVVAAAAIRFADAFLSLVAYGLAITVNTLFLLKFNDPGEIILPFESMAFSAAAYFLIKKLQVKSQLRFWNDCLWIIELAAMISFYASGNYLVVRKLTEDLLNVQISPGGDIRLSFFFYAYTILVPLWYIWNGLRKKNRLFIRLGVLTVAAGVLSIRYYHSFLPVETALILSGTLLIGVAWWSMRYLKTPRHGITFAPDDETSHLDKISNVVFSELVAQNQAVAPKEGDINLGGGEFGGGGAGATY